MLGVAFSPDGTLIATASADETSKVWRATILDGCELVALSIRFTDLQEALAGAEPTACTNLRR